MINSNLRFSNKQTHFYHVIQPIINLLNNGTHGYEVLLRSPDFPNPSLFFKHAMDHNLLFTTDMESISKALQTFNEEFHDMGDLSIHINIFPSTLVNPYFIQRFHEMTSKLHSLPKSIVFEINEAEKITDMDKFKEAILNLKNLGFLIALDDIGNGESSLKMLLEIEPDILKIDRYFANDLSKSTKKQEIIRSLVKLFDKETIVLEGLENDVDISLAREIGVPLGQGFGLGKPELPSHYISEGYVTARR